MSQAAHSSFDAPRVRAVVLDAGPLSLAANPNASPAGEACNQWIEHLLARGVEVFVPEIADYEVRRELIRARLTNSVIALDDFLNALDYLVLTTSVMRQAAHLWAQVRQSGKPTADPHALDGDVILAAQALALDYAPGGVVVATTNVGHLSRFITAQRWQDIQANLAEDKT